MMDHSDQGTVRISIRMFTSSVHKEMTSRNMIFHSDHVKLLKAKHCDCNAEPFKSSQVRNVVTRKEIDHRIF